MYVSRLILWPCREAEYAHLSRKIWHCTLKKHTNLTNFYLKLEHIVGPLRFCTFHVQNQIESVFSDIDMKKALQMMWIEIIRDIPFEQESLSACVLIPLLKISLMASSKSSSEVNLENAETFSNLRYVITHNLTIDHLLFADDVKLPKIIGCPPKFLAR